MFLFWVDLSEKTAKASYRPSVLAVSAGICSGHRSSTLIDRAVLPEKEPYDYVFDYCNWRVLKQFSVENKAKLSQLETQNTFAVLFIYNFQLESFALFSTDNPLK